MTKPPTSQALPPRYRRRRVTSGADLHVDTSVQQPSATDKPLTDSRNEAHVAACASAPIAHLRARGVFLLVMAFLVFAAFVLFVLSEMTHHLRAHQQQQLFDTDDNDNNNNSWTMLLFTPAMQRDIHNASVWVLVLAVPLTSAAAWFPVSIAHTRNGVVSITSPMRLPPVSPMTAARVARLPLLQRLATQFRTNHSFRALQTTSWLLYCVFLALVLGCPYTESNTTPVVASLLQRVSFCGFEHRSNVAVAAFIAHVLMSSSILALERSRSRDRRRRPSQPQPHAREARVVLLLNNFTNSLLVVGAVLLAVASETTRFANCGASDAYSLSAGVGSLALFVTAMLNTYGLGGLLARKRGWRFYQPFMGGAQFVACQVVSWTCFGAGVLVQGLYLLSLVLVEMELFVGVLAVAGALFAVSQVVMMVSVLVFRSPPPLRKQQQRATVIATASGAATTATAASDTVTESAVAGAASDMPSSTSVLRSVHAALQAFADECAQALIVSVLVNLQWLPSACFFVLYALTTQLDATQIVLYGLATSLFEIFFVLTRSIAIHLFAIDSLSGTRTDVSPYHIKYLVAPALSFALPAYATYYHYVHALPALAPVAALTLGLYGYSFTYRGAPQHTGVRMDIARMTRRSTIIEALVSYFSGNILRVAPLDPAQHYVMAFHPHGIMPTTCMWLTFTEQWRALFPGVQPHILTASVMHQIPLARDVMQTFGSLEVTRQAFKGALAAKRSVLLVPGGQAEMLEQHSGCRQVRVYTKHKGFVRVALEHGVPLVPVLSFQEGELMDNVKAPLVQRWFVKNLAFPFPYFPYGRALLPVPRKVAATVVVGAPIAVPTIASPTAADVDEYHARYFRALEDMFHTHKHAAGCSDYTLVLI